MFKFRFCLINDCFIIDNKKAHIYYELFGGAEGSRTPVQTYSSKAFYMLISLLLVGRKQEMNKPILCVAE
jgi:hypothetical protein